MIPYWDGTWMYLPDAIRAQLVQQAKDGPPLSPYAFHPENCPCLVCAWIREQDAQRGQHVPGSQRAVCGHERSCTCAECLAQRRRIAAGKLEAAKLIEAERARRKAAEAMAEDLPGAPEPEPGTAWVPCPGCTCHKCRMRRMEMVLEDALPDLRAACYAGQPCPRHSVPAPDCSSCAANAGLTVIKAGEEITSGKITVRIPGTAGVTAPGDRGRAFVPADPHLAEQPPDPAGEVEAALRDFDAWYAAGRGTLPDPEPLPAGICRSCHLSMAVTSCPPGIARGLCLWCDLADTVRAQIPDREAVPRGRRHVVCPLAAAWIAYWVLVVLTMTGVL